MKPGGCVANGVAALVTAILSAGSAACVRHWVHEPHPVAEAIALAAGKALDQLPPERTPAPSIQIDPPMVTFGAVGLRIPEVRTLVIRNVSEKPVGISKLTVSNRVFRVDAAQFPATIAARAELEVRLTFTPAEARRYLGTLVITMMSAEIVKVPLEGRAR